MSSLFLHGSNADPVTSTYKFSESLTVKAGGPASQPGRTRLALLLVIFAVALSTRMVSLGVIQHWPITSNSDLWKSGPEIVNIADSITSHRGFSSPFAIQSGPTAWIPPVYPYFIAAIFFLFGPRSNLAAFSILAAQAVFSALICFPIYFMGKKAFDERTARWASWSWALFPYAVLIPVLFIWETVLSALLLALLCQLCMDLPTARRGRLIGIGVLWGIAALTNTALLSVMPFFLLWNYRGRLSGRTWLRPVLTIGLAFALVVAPWFLRNWHVLGVIVPLRSNFGEELWLGNHEGGTGRTQFGLGPSENKGERERYRRLGEVAYVSQRKAEAFAFISQHPGSFINGALYRLRYWWFGEGESGLVFLLYRLTTLAAAAGLIFAWGTRTHGADLPIITLLIYPLVYYVTDIYARYRHPIEPFMILLGAFAVSQFVAGIELKWLKNQAN